jgi:hypothetical protein
MFAPFMHLVSTIHGARPARTVINVPSDHRVTWLRVKQPSPTGQQERST